MGLLRELADATGLSEQVTAVLADTYQGPWTYAPGAVFADLAAAVADGADCIDGIGQLCADREHAFGPKASTTTMWRLVDQRIDPELARAEIATFRYRVLHVAARITRGARQLRLRRHQALAAAIATAWQRLRAAFP